MELILIKIFGTVLVLAGIFLLVFYVKKRKNFLKQFSYNKKPDLDDFEELLSSSFYKSYSKDFRGAIEDINRALKIKPHMERLYFQRAKLREELKDLEGAKADYTKAILLKGNYDVAYLNRGLIKLKQKDYEGAKLDLDKAHELNTNLNEAGFFKREAAMHIAKIEQKNKENMDLFEDPNDTSQNQAL